ncbi:MAG: hypothetical protein ACI4BI_04870 [Anaerotardibacter sp.]
MAETALISSLVASVSASGAILINDPLPLVFFKLSQVAIKSEV